MQVVAILLVGARPEPYLDAVLDSLDGAIDQLVVNDNSGQPDGPNRRAIEASALHRAGRVCIVEAPFEGFARARNRCLEAARTVASPDAWVLMVDADEVHGPGLSCVTREVLATLPPAVVGVDGYVVQLMQTLDYFISLDRRHNLFYRLTPQARYERDVHEQLHGVEGRRVCLPYTYCHYGYVRPNQQILEKWRLYHGLGDPTYRAEDFPAQASPAMFTDQAPQCIPFTWTHPPALLASDARDLADAASTAAFRQEVDAYLRRPSARAWASLRRANYRLRLLWRLLESTRWVHRPKTLLGLARMTVAL